VPFSVVRPAPPTRPEELGILPLPELPETEIPLYGSLVLPEVVDEGPPDGLTLETAIALLIRDNLDLRARALELPQAEGDIITAGLLPNPIIFADAQLIPYGAFREPTAAGPTQYDLNITYPLDLSGKRRARVDSATRTRRVLEAQYHNAVRLQVDALYGAFVDVVAARELVQFARIGLKGLDEVLEKTETLYTQATATKVDLNRIRLQRETARIALADAEEAQRRVRRTLGLLLNIPADQAEGIEPRGSLRPPGVPLPPLDQLVAMALQCRPDAIAYRLGLGLAESDLRLARASRFEDVFLLYQPYTYQAANIQGPLDVNPSTSWAIGVTVPLPLFNRNQGNIHRAQVNITQTQTELMALSRRIATEVRDAVSEYHASLAVVRGIEQNLLAPAREIVEDSFRLLVGGETNAIDYLNAQREYNDVVRQYFSSLVRHRRGTLSINTAVGKRIMP
jgi:cobalt-zinc-cadmium efflux system outer membrane protein